MSTRARTVLAVVPLAIALVGCASGGGEEGAARRNRDVITEEELAQFLQWDCYNAIQQLRPSWLTVRRSVSVRGEGQDYPKVALDGMPQGDLGTLRMINVHDIREMRFLNAADATTRYGTGYPVGIIELWTK